MIDFDGIYRHRAQEAYYLHNPVTGEEIVVTPAADREAIARAIEAGATIIHQLEDGTRDVATIDDLPNPESEEPLKLVAPEYVDSRVALIEAMFSLMSQALQGFIPEGRFQALRRGLETAREAVASGDPAQIETAAADLGIADGPSIE